MRIDKKSPPPPVTIIKSSDSSVFFLDRKRILMSHFPFIVQHGCTFLRPEVKLVPSRTGGAVETDFVAFIICTARLVHCARSVQSCTAMNYSVHCGMYIVQVQVLCMYMYTHICIINRTTCTTCKHPSTLQLRTVVRTYHKNVISLQQTMGICNAPVRSACSVSYRESRFNCLF